MMFRFLSKCGGMSTNKNGEIKMTLNEIKLKRYYEDPKNWRPPSYSQIMKHMGWVSKNSVAKALKKLKWNLKEIQ